jgi:hypothetical protein
MRQIGFQAYIKWNLLRPDAMYRPRYRLDQTKSAIAKLLDDGVGRYLGISRRHERADLPEGSRWRCIRAQTDTKV